MKTENRQEVHAMAVATVMQMLTQPKMQHLVTVTVADTLNDLSKQSALKGHILSWEMREAQVREIAFSTIAEIGQLLDTYSGDVEVCLQHKTPAANDLNGAA